MIPCSYLRLAARGCKILIAMVSILYVNMYNIDFKTINRFELKTDSKYKMC